MLELVMNYKYSFVIMVIYNKQTNSYIRYSNLALFVLKCFGKQIYVNK